MQITLSLFELFRLTFLHRLPVVVFTLGYFFAFLFRFFPFCAVFLLLVVDFYHCKYYEPLTQHRFDISTNEVKKKPLNRLEYCYPIGNDSNENGSSEEIAANDIHRI